MVLYTDDNKEENIDVMGDIPTIDDDEYDGKSAMDMVD